MKSTNEELRRCLSGDAAVRSCGELGFFLKLQCFAPPTGQNRVETQTDESFVAVGLPLPVVGPSHHDSVVLKTTEACSLNSTHTRAQACNIKDILAVIRFSQSTRRPQTRICERK